MMAVMLERWRNCSDRERMMLAAGGVVAGASLVFVLVVDPLMAMLDRLDRQTHRKEKELRELVMLGQEYRAKRARLDQLESRMPTAEQHFSLLAFLEGAATTSLVRERITGMQPQVQTLAQGYQETAVDVRLEGVQLPELLGLLVAIEQAPHALHVRHLQIRPKFDNPVNLDATIRVLSHAKS